jgi:hypothetical protein
MEALLMIVVDASIFSWILLLLSSFMDFCYLPTLVKRIDLGGFLCFGRWRARRQRIEFET